MHLFFNHLTPLPLTVKINVLQIQPKQQGSNATSRCFLAGTKNKHKTKPIVIVLLYSAGNKLNASRNTPSRFIPYLYCVYVGRLHTLPMLVPGFVNPVSLLRTCPTPLWGTAGTVRACRRGPADCYRRGGNTVWVCGCVGGTINCILTKVAIFLNPGISQS